ncbi:sodium:calcium antiporter [Streptomyces sp. NP160]|nr:sodium:calcium antiporter [Streptomyces sp. NP160]
MLTLVLLLGCAVLIYLACEWFVNAVEWLGVRMAVGSAVVGTVLAAAGTALPESVVTLVAVLFGSPETGADVGVGAALGGPLVVGSLAYAVVGVVLLGNRRGARRGAARAAAAERVSAAVAASGVAAGRRPSTGGSTDAEAAQLAAVDTRSLARDQAWFLVSFAAAASLGLVAFAVKPWLGWLLFGAYAVYCWRQVRSGGDAHSAEDLEPLKAQPRRERPSTTAVVAQVVVSLAVIFAASQVFVGQLEALAPQLGLSASLVALLLAPIATELPEVLNALIWVRQGKAFLALGNLAGSMVIQATIPTGLGLAFTSWHVEGPLLLAVVATLAVVGYLLVLFATRRVTAVRLAAASSAYAAFAVGLAVTTA